MAGNSEVIREFMVSLGFSVDTPDLRKFTEALGITSKGALRTGAAVLGVAAAAEAMVVAFSRSMEKMYYAAQRNRTTVESIQAIRYAAQQVGVDADDAANALESFSQVLRTQPGSRGLLQNLLGTSIEGKDNVRLFYDLIARLRSLPHEFGAQWAEQFGISEPVFFMLKARFEELLAADAKRRKMNRDAGIDAQKAAEASREYMNTLRDLWKQVGLLADRLAIDLLPSFREFASVARDGLSFLTKLDYTGLDKLLESVVKQSRAWGEWGKGVKTVTEGIQLAMKPWRYLYDKSQTLFGSLFGGEAGAYALGGPNYKEGGRRTPLFTPEILPYLNKSGQKMFRNLGGEQLASEIVGLKTFVDQYRSGSGEMTGDDLNFYDLQVAQARSRIAMLRAQGFVPAGSDAAAAASAEKDLAKAGISIHQENHISVTSPDPATAGKAVAREQERVGGSLVRNLQGALR